MTKKIDIKKIALGRFPHRSPVRAERKTESPPKTSTRRKMPRKTIPFFFIERLVHTSLNRLSKLLPSKQVLPISRCPLAQDAAHGAQFVKFAHYDVVILRIQRDQPHLLVFAVDHQLFAVCLTI